MGCPLTRRLAFGSQSPVFHMPKCPLARHWTSNGPWQLCWLCNIGALGLAALYDWVHEWRMCELYCKAFQITRMSSAIIVWGHLLLSVKKDGTLSCLRTQHMCKALWVVERTGLHQHYTYSTLPTMQLKSKLHLTAVPAVYEWALPPLLSVSLPPHLFILLHVTNYNYYSLSLSINQSIKCYLYSPYSQTTVTSHRALTRCDILCP